MNDEAKSIKQNIFDTFIPQLFTAFGESSARDGLVETPRRVMRMYDELLAGYSQDPALVFKTFENYGYNDLVTVANIEFYSLCEHHMIPFYGKVHIGYLPNGKILGLSKFARLVEIFSRRLQTQENLTNQIAEALNTYLQPKGYIVHTEATHLCVAMRGIKKSGFITKTTVKYGELKTNSELINQFYHDIGESDLRKVV